MTIIQMVVQVMHFLEEPNSSLSKVEKEELCSMIRDIDVVDYDEYKIVLDEGIFLKNLAFGKNEFVSDIDLGLCDVDDEYDSKINVYDLLLLADERDIFDLACDFLNVILLLNS